MQNGRCIDVIGNVINWLNENIEQMYSDFIDSKPNYDRLLLIHKWYDPDRFKKEEH